MKSKHNEVIGPLKNKGEGHLEVITCEVNGFSIRLLVSELCPVESHMKMSFRDTWWLSVWEKKNKRSNKIACRWLLQVCMGKVDMVTLATQPRSSVFMCWPTNARVALKETEKTHSLWNQCTMKSLGLENTKGEGHLEVIACQETNEVDGSLI